MPGCPCRSKYISGREAALKGGGNDHNLCACITDEPWQFSSENDYVDQNRSYDGRLETRQAIAL